MSYLSFYFVIKCLATTLVSERPEARTTYYPVKLQRRLETCKIGLGWNQVVCNVRYVMQPADQLFQLTAERLCRQIKEHTVLLNELRFTFPSRGFWEPDCAPFLSVPSLEGSVSSLLPCLSPPHDSRPLRGQYGFCLPSAFVTPKMTG